MKYTPDDIAEIARLTGWHLGTARPSITPAPPGTELAGWWYDAAGRAMACAFTDALMGETQYSVEQAREEARERANPLGGFLSDENSPDHPTV